MSYVVDAHFHVWSTKTHPWLKNVVGGGHIAGDFGMHAAHANSPPKKHCRSPSSNYRIFNRRLHKRCQASWSRESGSRRNGYRSARGNAVRATLRLLVYVIYIFCGVRADFSANCLRKTSSAFLKVRVYSP